MKEKVIDNPQENKKSLLKTFLELNNIEQIGLIIAVSIAVILIQKAAANIYIYANEKINHPLYFEKISKEIDPNLSVDEMVKEYINKEREYSHIEDDEELLKVIFYEITNYISFNDYYTDEMIPDNELWYKEIAKKALITREGSCYYYASTFALFAKELGYEDVFIINGMVSHDASMRTATHHWVLIDGKAYDAAYDATPKVSLYDEIEYYGVDYDYYEERDARLQEKTRNKIN